MWLLQLMPAAQDWPGGLPKSINLEQIAPLLIHNEASGHKRGVKAKALCGAAHALQILQHVVECFAFPGVHIVVYEGVVHVIPYKNTCRTAMKHKNEQRKGAAACHKQL